MKVKRQKNVRRILTFYRNNFSIIPSYNVLIDGTFCKAALTSKVNISEQLPKYLDAEVRLYTTKCAMAECEAFGSLLYGPLKVLRQYDVAHCGHTEAVPAAKCLHRMTRKSQKGITRKFFIATQDAELSKLVRKTAGVPLLFISFNAMTLESPSDQDTRKAEAETEKRLNPIERLRELKKAVLGKKEEEPKPKKKRKKKVPGPNPLSCKKGKKKKTGVQGKGKVEKKPQRKRHKRIHVPEHVKQVLKQQ